MKQHITLSIFLFISICLSGQNARQYTNNNNAWIMYFGTHKFADKWSLHLEAQFRRHQLVTNPQQLLLRTGINYHLNPQAMLTLGYCFVETYPYGDFPVRATFPENRIWEQLQLKNQVGRFEWISRFRLEQRWSNLPVLQENIYEPGDAVYTNRFRLLNRFSLPFKGKTIEDKSLYLSVYDEFMINFGKNVGLNIMDQNRAYAAIGYKIPKVGRLELGYMNQLIFKGDGIKVENNHTLQAGLSCAIDFKK
ncbi:MAG: DUF2490 domain-containing protein [Saprospiraceae bacterium]